MDEIKIKPGDRVRHKILYPGQSARVLRVRQSEKSGIKWVTVRYSQIGVMDCKMENLELEGEAAK